MFVAVFQFEVAPEKQEAFLEAVKETIKPYWESHGCWEYNVYQEYDAAKGHGTRFIKTQVMEGMPTTLEETRAKRSEEATAIVDLFYRYATDVSIKAYVKRA